MKRLALACSVVVVTFLLGIVAVSVAQRDARNRESVPIVRPDYAMQSPEPFRASIAGEDESIESDSSAPPLDVPPPLSRNLIVRGNDEEVNTDSPVVLASDNQLISPPSLTPTPLPSGFSPPPLGSNLQPPSYAGGNNSPTTNSPTNNSPAISQPRIGAPTSSSSRLSDSGPSQSLASPTTYSPPNTSAIASPPSGFGQPSNLGSTPIAGQLAAPGQVGSLGQPPNLSSPPNANSPKTTAPAYGSISSPVGSQAENFPPPSSAYTPIGESSDRSAATQSPSLEREPVSEINRSASPYTSAPPNGLPDRNPSSMRTTSSSFAARNDTPLQSGYPRSGAARNIGANLAELVAETPGKRQLDGPQNPNMQLQKRAPEEVQVGQPATFSLIVRNVGNATAHDVTVYDRVPKGTQLSRMNPPAEQESDGTLVWSLGEMAAGAEVTLAVELIPETEGEIGSTASVTFATQASVRTVSTQPKLEISQEAGSDVLVGEVMNIRVQVTNSGSGVAKDVALETDVPSGFKSTLGPSLGLALGDLAPGESRTVPLDLVAVEPGNVRNLIRAVATNAAAVDSVSEMRIVAPQLKLNIVGPKLRYLERQATYQLTMVNSGTSVARNIDIIAYLPKGLQFNSAANGGEYLSTQHAVAWGLDELAAGKSATTELVVMPVEEGDYVVRVQGQADGVRAEPVEKQLLIQGQSEMSFTIEDDNDPIETDGQTTYQVKVTNIGTRNDSNVQVAVELPQGAEVLQINAPVAYQVSGNGILFEPVAEMRAKDQQIFRFTVRLPREGLQVVRALVKSSQRPVATAKEESTEVYPDN